MQFTAVSVLALAATAAATYGNVSYTTEVVTEVTTYCPEATQLSYNGQTYTITEVRTPEAREIAMRTGSRLPSTRPSLATIDPLRACVIVESKLMRCLI
jgi:hypothetical protein